MAAQLVITQTRVAEHATHSVKTDVTRILGIAIMAVWMEGLELIVTKFAALDVFQAATE
jgi:hypothetical protein